jgi:hypothetical protein
MPILDRLKLFLTFRDSRFEDLTRDNARSVIYRDFSAGLVTAMTAIPMAMGFAMAMGLHRVPRRANLGWLEVPGLRTHRRLHSSDLRDRSKIRP